jgi:hypothetical protein
MLNFEFKPDFSSNPYLNIKCPSVDAQLKTGGTAKRSF